jgi:hypothetical protein
VQDLIVRPYIQVQADSQRRYALCGTRLYSVATLDGLFPDMGWHQPKEMGGIWAPPIKLLDGYWLGLRASSAKASMRAFSARLHPTSETPLTDAYSEEPIQWLTSPITWQIEPAGATLSYSLPALGLQVQRQEWIVPDESALVIEVTISLLATASHQGSYDFDCGLLVRSDLHGAWLAAERLGWPDGDDIATYDTELAAVILRDSLHPTWMACVGATTRPIAWQTGNDVWGPERTSGRGTGAVLWYRCQVTPAEPGHLCFLIAGSTRDSEPATTVFTRMVSPAGYRLPSASKAEQVTPSSGSQHDRQPFSEPGDSKLAVSSSSSLLKRGERSDLPGVSAGQTPLLKQAHQRAIAAFCEPFQRCVLQSPDPTINKVFAWAKANTAQLLLDVPGIGRAAMAGLPDFPWWFGCDIAYGVLPMLPAGQTAAASASLRTLAAVGQRSDANGVVPHEIAPYGLVIFSGNLVEMPLFARALYHTYRWTGDRSLLADLFPFCMRGMQQWALGTCLKPGELVPRGSSIVETPEMTAGLQVLDVAAYLVEALDLLGELASDLGQHDRARDLRARSVRIQEHVRNVWWLPAENLFGDVYASRAELQSLLSSLAKSTNSAGDPSILSSIATLRHALENDWASSWPQDAPRPWLLRHMVQALAADAGLPTPEQAAKLLERLETPEWTEEFGIVLNAVTNRQVMTLPTGALAAGEARYGRANYALDYIRRMAATFGIASPVTLSEYSPSGGCFLQLWSSYGIIWPIVHYFFGLRPDVAAQRLLCAPQLPPSWPQARLSAIPLGAMCIDVELIAIPDGLQVRLQIPDPTWKVSLGVATPNGVHVTSAVLNGKPVALCPVWLAGHEGRETWVAPVMHGATSYELAATWSENPAFSHYA